MNNLVSVMIPSYNHEAYIYNALYSVYNQTYKDIELIVIDDASKDKTFKIIEEICSLPQFQKRFSNSIFMKNEKNMGAHATINKGISLSSGKFISILNSDDYYHPERIEKLIQLFKNDSEYFFAFSNYIFIDDKNEEIPLHPLNIELQTSLKEALKIFSNLSFIFLRKQVALSTGNFFFTKSLWERIGGFLNLRYCHDLDFILQSLRYTPPVFLDEPLYYYRVHAGNTFSTVQHLALIETEIVLTRYFKNTHYGELINRNAPCSRNFPLYFEELLKVFNLEAYYTKAITGYQEGHRVIDKKIFERVKL